MPILASLTEADVRRIVREELTATRFRQGIYPNQFVSFTDQSREQAAPKIVQGDHNSDKSQGVHEAVSC
jgi:hypothetical protein